MARLEQAWHIDIDQRQAGGDLGERAAVAAGFQRHPAAGGADRRHGACQHRLEPRQEPDIAEQRQPGRGEVGPLFENEREIDRLRRPHMMGKAALAAGIDQRGGGAGGERGMGLQRASGDPLSLQPAANLGPPEIVPHQA